MKTQVTQVTDIKQAVEILGGNLSEPSKMPCFGFSIPASHCITGRKLRAIKGTICQVCYALKGNYTFPKVQAALEKRYVALTSPLWVAAMTFLINAREKSGYFRFHDSGDLQSVSHFENIVAVCNNLPHIKFWLPTREFGIVGDFLRAGGVIPENLTVRYSALKIDGPLPIHAAKNHGVQVSGASKENFNCPASFQENKCADCRLCWNKNVMAITYKKH